MRKTPTERIANNPNCPISASPLATHILMMNDPDPQDGGWTKLHHAAFDGKQEVASLIAQHPESMVALNNRLQTALHLAAHQGHACILEMMLVANPKKGSKRLIDICSSEGKTALHHAAAMGHIETVHVLLAGNPATSFQTCSPLHLAAANNHVEIAKLLIAAGLRVSAMDSSFQSPMVFAAGGNGGTSH